jgi:hypothetical protein
MNIDRDYFRTILDELIEENPLACQGILSISEIAFTESVPTLAVTLNEEFPRLLVNLGFIREHCTEEVHVKTLLLHEFLHVLLNHTGEYKVWDPIINIALDAVINHIIHRSCGPEYSEFCRLYYKDADINDWRILLAPPETSDHIQYDEAANGEIVSLRYGLLEGEVLADDILDIARDIQERLGSEFGQIVFLGNHDPDLQRNCRTGGEMSEVVVRALNETFRQLNGDGIFREPAGHGFAEPASVSHEWNAREEKLRRWERTAWKALRPLLTPDPQSSRFTWEDRRASLPVLNGGDRRGFLRSLWNPIVPEIRWNLPERRPAGTTVVYLDVSGSMNAEMQSLVTLLNRLRRWIRLPFWAFSNEVAPATIEKGVLKTKTTGGTAMNCVLTHLAETRPEKALVLTDGYIERCDPALLKAASGTRLYALISRDGSAALLDEAGIPCTQLSEYPD